MSQDLHLFSSPRLQYLSMKRDFLRKFLDRRAWGEFGSTEQRVAVSGLLEYYKETENLAVTFPQLSSDVTIDNKNLVLEHILPFPPKLFEQLISAAVGEDHQHVQQYSAGELLERIESYLIRKKSACLAFYEHKVSAEVHDYKSYTFENAENLETNQAKSEDDFQAMLMARMKLRRFRNKIYSRLGATQHVKKHVRKYKSLVKAFIKRFDSDLTVEQVEELQDRVRRTENSARLAKAYQKEQKKLRTDSVTKLYNPNSAPEASEKENKHNLEDVCDNNSTELKDQVVLILPDVPRDSDDDVIDMSASDDVDAQIERRLTRLKFFSKVWCQSTVASVSPPELKSRVGAPEVASNDVSTDDVEDSVAVYSTEAERDEFNQWYLCQVTKANTTTTTCSSQVMTSSEVTKELHLSTMRETQHQAMSSEFQDSAPLCTGNTAMTMDSVSELLESMMVSYSRSNIPMLTVESEYKSLEDTSEHHSSDMVISSQLSDNYAGSVNQQEILDVVINLFLMQANMVIMVMSAAFILQKINLLTWCDPYPDQLNDSDPNDFLIHHDDSSLVTQTSEETSIQEVCETINGKDDEVEETALGTKLTKCIIPGFTQQVVRLLLSEII